MVLASHGLTNGVTFLPSLPHLLEGLVIGDAELVQPNLPGDGEEKEVASIIAYY